MDLDKKFDLITRNTKDIMTKEELRRILNEKRSLSAYYGTAPTGPFHIGYLASLSKIFDFGLTGIRTKILIADLHAALDDLKAKWEELDLKSEYYKKCLELAFPWENPPEFVRGSSYQLDKEYFMDVLKISTFATIKRTIRAASEVCRMKNPKVGELIYPIMQALDEEYLRVDIQLGGIDQRHIMAFAREYLPMIGYKKRVEIMVPLTTSLQGPGTKMSASIPMTHIKIYESEESTRKKIKKAYCPEGVIESNPIIEICKFLVFPVKGKIKIERDEKHGGDLEIDTYEELEKQFKEKKIHPLDLKNSVADYLIENFKKVRKYFDKHTDILKELGEEFF